MNTKQWIVDDGTDLSTTYPQLSQPAQLLRENEVVAFPTETVYGLGANAFSDEAVRKIYEAKGRPSDNPLIVHIASISKLDEIVQDIPEYAYKLMNEFWPGPLTLILPKKGNKLSTIVTAGLDTVGVRMPNHPVALKLIQEADVPIAAPSANKSGKPSPTHASHVYHDLNGKISGIVDGGATGVGVESTVLDCTTTVPTILRPGGVTKEQLESVIGEVTIDQALLEEGHAPKSPGMKYTHYAPNAPVFVVHGGVSFLQEIIDQYQKEGKKVGVLTTEEHLPLLHAHKVITCGTLTNLQTVAAQLYDVLRKFDEEDIDLILSESFPYDGVGEAIMNRLLKAAGNKVIK
ncbi:L-threonylcarbamoyladenylate synthase [Metabacillus sediminilitoris]|uniref:Threonylcarbamoyl-AMP synthase n=1 Tax=Metabacillus sediminilitoris TaxID=2567941 RepID=A0A4S4BVI3_9BACI|nr:L-threonylcarbamoyladenylate synthase [Metabacillus sediminilitoris]QGQ48354.1 threonylcarbamoyl-AMP synthase [Metabacillus sediminilitoris]THF77010.1 threonylcarbamoyl-AMP synthase [Metabacillus sediminilitoris]